MLARAKYCEHTNGIQMDSTNRILWEHRPPIRTQSTRSFNHNQTLICADLCSERGWTSCASASRGGRRTSQAIARPPNTERACCVKKQQPTSTCKRSMKGLVLCGLHVLEGKSALVHVATSHQEVPARFRDKQQFTYRNTEEK